MNLKFANIYFLYALPLIIIPIIIHILNKQKNKIVYFSNMRILSLAASNFAYNIKLLNILSLIIRILILIFLILYFAAPQLEKKSKEKLMFNEYHFYLDNSEYMSAKIENQNNLEFYKDLLTKFLTDKKYGHLHNKIKIIELDKNNNKIIQHSTINAKLQYIHNLKLDESNFLFSQLQKKYDNQSDTLLIILTNNRINDKLLKNTNNIILCAPQFDFKNTAITKINAVKKTLLINEPIDLEIEIYSDTTEQNILTIYGISENGGIKQTLANFNITLNKGLNTLNLKFQQPSNIFKFALAELQPDAIDYDNYYYFTLPVKNPYNTLLIEDNKDTNTTYQLLSATNHKITKINYSDFLKNTDKFSNNYELAVFNNLLNFDNTLIDFIKKTLQNGAHIFIIPDENINLSIINDYLGRQYINEEPLLPIYFSGKSSGRSFQRENIKFLERLYAYNIDNIFNAKPYIEFDHKILAVFDNNNPAAVIKKYNNGCILIFTFNHKLKNSAVFLTPEYFYKFNSIISELYQNKNIEIISSLKKIDAKKNEKLI
ncbi:MAG TPA: BatA domain-containing protein, partial [bacterium]|nr:BatA domain-containing protein [bacterium]